MKLQQQSIFFERVNFKNRHLRQGKSAPEFKKVSGKASAPPLAGPIQDSKFKVQDSPEGIL
ncbi:MAG: hypothetical protein K9L59_06050 [Desulfobacterales bacterium]|nr:hypothetical protein [Desulfobacterales bacterium]MCF8079725.1 hypothetical protein [Desulfobacterales bacterium]